MPGQVVLISGCSSGFGRELALVCLDRGYKVIATARKVERLQELKTNGAEALQLDVTASPEELAHFAKEAVALHGRVDILINNAGYLLAGAIEESTHGQNVALFNTCFFGVINLVNAFLPYMRQQRSGTIVNMSSQGGSMNIPGGGLYCASKAAVDSISDTWSRELAPFGIRCVSVQPGPFLTNVADPSAVSKGAYFIDGYETAHAWIEKKRVEAGKERGDARKGAERIINLIEHDQLPMRFALGDDAHPNIIMKLHERIDEFAQWKELSIGTDRDNL